MRRYGDLHSDCSMSDCVFELLRENTYRCRFCGTRITTPQLPIYRQCGNAAAKRTPCIFLGAATGDVKLVKCNTCRGNVRKKYPIFHCLCPSHAAEPTTTLADCRRCRDYRAQ